VSAVTQPQPLQSFLLRGKEYMPGVLFSITIAMAAAFISGAYGGPTVLFALLLGMAFNFISAESRLAPGIAFSSRSVLRLGVAALGARITAEQVLGLGWSTLVGVAAAVALTILFGLLAAQALGLKRQYGHTSNSDPSQGTDHLRDLESALWGTSLRR
jgi:uncharacterized membrane protein YadS